jgi:L-fucose mutarotase
VLKGVHPLLGADLLHALCAMGHGDELVIVDRNFPATALATRLVTLPGHPAPPVLEAICTVFPVDDYVDEPLIRMEVVGDPATVTAVQLELQAVVARAEGRPVALGSLDRAAFYERARRAFVIVATGESRGYANLVVTKGGVAG